MALIIEADVRVFVVVVGAPVPETVFIPLLVTGPPRGIATEGIEGAPEAGASGILLDLLNATVGFMPKPENTPVKLALMRSTFSISSLLSF